MTRLFYCSKHSASATDLSRPCVHRYTMIGVCPVLFVGWKMVKRTKWHRLEDVDLLQNVDEIEEYQRTYVPSKPR